MLVFKILFLFCVYLCLCQSVGVSVHLFRNNLKFLKIRNCWLAQLLYVSLVSALELKTCRMHIRMLRNSSKKKSWGRHYCQGLGRNSVFSSLNSYCYYDYYFSNSDKISGKVLLIKQNHLSDFMCFFLKTKRRTDTGIWKLCSWSSYCYSYWNS